MRSRHADLLDEVDERDWRRPNGIFVVAEVGGDLGERIRELQQRFDPKLAAQLPPHITIIGSSGVGPIEAGTPVTRVREALEPIARETPPLTLELGAPIRFMQSDIIVLPLDPHGPLRTLHERIRQSGLRFQRARFTFTPHVTLSFYRTLSPDERRALLGVRMTEPLHIDRIGCSLTRDPLPPVQLMELEQEGGGEERATSDERRAMKDASRAADERRATGATDD